MTLVNSGAIDNLEIDRIDEMKLSQLKRLRLFPHKLVSKGLCYSAYHHTNMLTQLCYLDPLTPRFYIVKLGCIRVYTCTFFLFLL